jgi:hypothetical protein
MNEVTQEKATTEARDAVSSALQYEAPDLSARGGRTEATLDDQFGKLPISRWRNTGRIWYVPLTNIATSASVGDSFHSFTVPPVLDGARLIGVAAAVVTTSAAGGPILIQLNNGTSDILTTRINIADSTKLSWATGTTQPVIDEVQAVLRAGTQIDVDIDDIGDGNAFGWQLYLYLQ